MVAKVIGLTHILGSYLVTITLGQILKPFEEAKLKQMGHLLGWHHYKFGEGWNIFQKSLKVV